MAKRRAAARRRNRDMVRRVGAIFFVILFGLGTATTIFVFQSTPPASNSTGTGAITGSSIPLSTVVPAGSAAASVSTPSSGQAGSLVKQAQDAANQGKWQDAISFYNAALGLSPDNASVEYDLGKAYIQIKDYGLAVQHLQDAVNLNPQAAFVSDAQNLINTYKGQVTSGTAATPGTSPNTSTTPATK